MIWQETKLTILCSLFMESLTLLNSLQHCLFLWQVHCRSCQAILLNAFITLFFHLQHGNIAQRSLGPWQHSKFFNCNATTQQLFHVHYNILSFATQHPICCRVSLRVLPARFPMKKWKYIIAMCQRSRRGSHPQNIIPHYCCDTIVHHHHHHQLARRL